MSFIRGFQQEWARHLILVFTASGYNERDTAVAFLADLSSSTNELANGAGKRILDVEREALVVISGYR